MSLPKLRLMKAKGIEDRTDIESPRSEKARTWRRSGKTGKKKKTHMERTRHAAPKDNVFFSPKRVPRRMTPGEKSERDRPNAR